MAIEKLSARQVLKNLLADGKEWKTEELTRHLEKKGYHRSLASVTLSFMIKKGEAKRVAPATYQIVSEHKPFKQAVQGMLERKFINDGPSVVSAVKKYCRTHNHKPIARISAMMALSNFSPSAVSAAFPAGVKAGWLERVSRGTYRWKDKDSKPVVVADSPPQDVEETINVRDAVILLNQAKRYMVNKESPEYHLAALAGLYLQGKMK